MTPPQAQAEALRPPPPLREISGPSAFGGEWRRFFSLLWLNAATDFKLRYLHSALGYGWSLLRPLLEFAVLYVVFTQVIRFGGQIENYAALLLFNLMLFQLFTDGTVQAVRSTASNENLVRKMQFPRIVIPLSVVLNACITTLMNLVAALLILIAIGIEPRLTWLLIPVVLLAMVIFVTGVALLLSSLFVRFRDVEQIWAVAVRALFYATPVLYAIEIVPESLRPIVLANPLTPILEQARIWVIDPSAPSIADVAPSTALVVLPFVIAALVCVLGLWKFEREAPRIAEDL